MPDMTRYVAVGYGAHGDGDGEGEGHEPEVERHVGDGEETVTETWGVVLYHDGEEEVDREPFPGAES